MRSPRAFVLRPAIILLLTQLAFTSTSLQTQTYLICKLPNSLNCLAWILNEDQIVKATNIPVTCGLSDLPIIPSDRTYILVKKLNAFSSRRVLFCENIRIKRLVDWKEVAEDSRNLIRVRRQGFIPRGRYRGQTQSQYLTIDRGTGKDEGKAEAHSAADSSRASVSGNSGMGQAQSQSIYDPNCDDCNGKTNNEVENLRRSNGLSPEQGYDPNKNLGWSGKGGPEPSHSPGGFNRYDLSPYATNQKGPGSKENVLYGPRGIGEGPNHTGGGPGSTYGPNGITSDNYDPRNLLGTTGNRPIDSQGGNVYRPSSGNYVPIDTNRIKPGGNGDGVGYPGVTGQSNSGLVPNTNVASGGYNTPNGRNNVYGGTYDPNKISGGPNVYEPQRGSGSNYKPEQDLNKQGFTPGSIPTGIGNTGPQNGQGQQVNSPENIYNGKTGTTNSIPGYTQGPNNFELGSTPYRSNDGSSRDHTPGILSNQAGPSNWPAALGPYSGPGGSSVYCCVVPNTGTGGQYGPSGSWGQYGPGGTTGQVGQYGPGGTTGSGGQFNPTGSTGPEGQYRPVLTGGQVSPGGTTLPGGQYGPGTSTSIGRQYGPGGVNIPEGKYGPGVTTGNGGQYGPGRTTESGGQFAPGETPGSRGQYGPGAQYGPGGTVGSEGQYGPGGTTAPGGQYAPGGTTGTGRQYGPGGTTVPRGQYAPGGTTGTGRQYGPGGTTVPGGQYAPGGTTGSGGQYGPGGTTAPGGQYAPGETTGSGGQYGPGGTIAPGGQYAPGGTTGSGGQYGPGGTTAPGGQYAPGGTTGSGGQYGPGGTIAPGGQYAPGGTTGSGGQYGPGGITAPGRQYTPGGTTGSGGQYGPGGTTAPGGPYAPGGTTGSGGQYGPGGTTAPGRQYVPGGTTGSGGQYGPGGTTAPGGQYVPGATTGSGGQYVPGGTTGSEGQYGPVGSTLPQGQYGPGGTTGSGRQYSPGGPAVSGGQYGPGGTTGSGGQYGPGGITAPGLQYAPGGTSASGGQYGPGGTTAPRGQYAPGETAVSGGQYGPGGPTVPGGQYATGGTTGPGGQYGPGGTSVPGGQYGPGGTNGPGGQYPPGGTTGSDRQYTPGGTAGSGPRYGPGATTGTGGTTAPGGQFGPGGVQYGPDGSVISGSQPGSVGTTGPGGQYGNSGSTGSGGQYGPGGTTGPEGQYGPGGTFRPGEQYGPGGKTGYGPGGPTVNGGQYMPGGTSIPVGQYQPGVDGTGQYGPGSTTPPRYNQGGSGGQNNDINGAPPQNYVDPNSITADGDDSQAEASVAQNINGTTASASSRGGNDKGRAQTNVQGTYSGSGSFQAQAQITGENKEAQSEVSGGKKGASSSATGSGRDNKSQANVQLGSETGSVQTQSQSNGVMHSSNSQVQGSVKGGMADAQARGPGSTSSQAQIGFTPYKDEEKTVHDLQKLPFVGGGVASAQSSGRTGQSQSQLHGTFKYGITYNGAAQSGASLDKDAIFPNRLSFDKIDVFDDREKNINVDKLGLETTEIPLNLNAESSPVDTSTVNSIDNKETEIPSTENVIDESMKNSESRYSGHTHSSHHNPESFNTTDQYGPTLSGSRRSFQTNYPNPPEYEYTTDKDDNPPEYDGFDSDGNDINDVEQTEYSNYDEYTRESPTHQYLQNPIRKGIDVQQTTGGNTQHIVLGSLKNHNAEIIQKDSDVPDEGKVYQPGERIPGTGGYTIPVGFTGSVKSVASKDNTYVIGSKDSPSQAQSVTLTPGTGKVRYSHPYRSYVKPKNLRSLQNTKEKENDDRYLSVSKSVTRALDSDNNIRKQYSHTYYTKSSSCGYFTFTCTMVSSAEGRKKVCKPKMPTNPDGSPIRC